MALWIPLMLGAGAGALFYDLVSKAPAQGSIPDTFNDAVEAGPKIAKYAMIGTVATAAAMTAKAVFVKGKK